jgi:hypothetical protein
MGRPAGYEWRPLGLDTDPVPGDPARIRDEASHLDAVAKEITAQVSALRQIGADGTEVGEHADKIRSTASDLASQLDKVVGRYQKVSSALQEWAPQLEAAQALSLQALNEAEGPYKKLNQTVALPSGPNLTAQQKQGITDYQNAMKQAQGEIAQAQALLTRATNNRDSAGSTCAGQINNACNDGMRDHHSLFGSIFGAITGAFSFVVHHWAQIVGDICTVLEIVATVLAIFAFIVAQFIPGVDILVDLAATAVLAGTIMTGVALAGRTLLAATGNGSWMDVGMDAFALATFGLGRLMGAGARMLVPGAEAASKLALVSELTTDVAQGGPRAAMIARFAAMEGTDSISMAVKLGRLAPDLANGAKLEELSPFAKAMMNIGGFGKEEETFATLVKLGSRFTGTVWDLSNYATAAKVLAGVTGVSTAAAGLTGIAGTVANGVGLSWGNWSGTLDVPSWHNWYTNTFEVPTGAPAGG